jgi:acetoin utilization deacetylase AcuC-like enzyme
LKYNLGNIILNHQPDFVFYLSGVDVLSTDKLGKLNLSLNGCKERDEIVLKTCKLMSLPVQVSMGGGYSPKVSDIVEAHCNTYRIAHNLYF